ncbi:MAG: polysaccharide biosynthesis C-terminal domain-containing protein, partial [Bacteroidota bacterium]
FVFFSALFSALLLIFKSYLLQIFTETQDFRYFDLLIIYILLANPGYMIEFIYLVKNRPKNILVYGLLFFFLQIIAAGLPPVFGYDIIYSIYGLISLSVIRLIWLGVLIFRHSIIRISFPYLREHISVGYPLIISVLLSGSAQYVDGYLVSQYYSREVFAVFRYGARELPFVVLMANALSNSMLPEMSLKNGFSGALASIKRKSLRLMHFVFPAAIIIMFFSHWLFPIIYNEGFRESATIFNIYLLLTISYMVFPQTVLIGLKRTRTIMLTSFIELVINVALSILLIRYLNIAGVALATVIAYYSEKAILIIFNSAYKIRPASYIPLGWLLFYSVITLAVYVLIEYKPLNLL